VQIIIETNIGIPENYAYIYMRKSTKIWYNILYSMVFSPPSNSRQVGIGRDIGVCIREKCRKGGAQRLMASLQERIPEAAKIFFTSCKCMGKCRSAANIRVQKDEEPDPQLPAMIWRKMLECCWDCTLDW
jgi:NADH:ubiquinone oxidoreductase subunit E